MLEAIEWSNVWREHCTENRPRVLIVGDSIMNGCRMLVGEVLGDRYAVTVLATSKAIDNPFFAKELDLLMEQEGFAYEAVYFNSGLHTGGLTPAQYAEHYAAMLDQLVKVLPGVPVVLGLSTPVAYPNADPGKTDAPISALLTYGEANEKVLDFNREVRQIAEKRGMPMLDAYAVMDGHPEWRTMDGYHYNEDGYRHLAAKVAGALQPYLK